MPRREGPRSRGQGRTSAWSLRVVAGDEDMNRVVDSPRCLSEILTRTSRMGAELSSCGAHDRGDPPWPASHIPRLKNPARMTSEGKPILRGHIESQSG